MAHPISGTFVNGPYEVRGTLPSSSDKPKDRGGLLRVHAENDGSGDIVTAVCHA